MEKINHPKWRRTSLLTFQTAYIKSHVINIQEATGKSVKRIREFSAVVQEVNDLIASISTAIEEQSGMTQEIAANVSRTSEQLNRINGHTTRSATTSEAIVADMQGLNSEAVQTSKCGIEVDRNVAELSQLSQQLKTLVGRFVVS